MDLIICWPDNCDYPLWRAFIKAERRKFQKVLVVWTKSNQGYNYKDFVEESMTDNGVTFLTSPELKSKEDWRDVAVNFALDKSDAPWVWFTEQDVFILDPKFWVDVILKIRDNDAVLYQENSRRTHPCMAFVKRTVINQTSRDFAVQPDRADHFARFFSQLALMPIKTAWLKRKYFYHMNGLSHNMSLLERGEPVTYDPAGFKEYLGMCLNEPNLDPHFVKLVGAYL